MDAKRPYPIAQVTSCYHTQWMMQELIGGAYSPSSEVTINDGLNMSPVGDEYVQSRASRYLMLGAGGVVTSEGGGYHPIRHRDDVILPRYPLALLVVPVDEEDQHDRSHLRLRVEKTIDGVSYAAYYGYYIDHRSKIQNVSVDLTDWNIVSRFRGDPMRAKDRTIPSPVVSSSSTGRFFVSQYTLDVHVGPSMLKSIRDGHEIEHGDSDIKISEVFICSGVEVIDNDRLEAADVQPHIMVAKEPSDEFELSVNLGINEPIVIKEYKSTQGDIQ